MLSDLHYCFMLADSIDTPKVMRLLKDLVTTCNIYMTEATSPNGRLLENVAVYCTKMLQIFGVIPSGAKIGYPVESQSLDVEATIMPFVSLAAEFREEVRQISLKEKC